jgi:hypothetical protein
MKEDEFPTFEITIVEVCMIYASLYGSSCIETDEDVKDEIQRRELFPGIRHKIDEGLARKNDLQSDLRDYLVNYLGEPAVLEMEASVRKSATDANAGTIGFVE